MSNLQVEQPDELQDKNASSLEEREASQLRDGIGTSSINSPNEQPTECKSTRIPGTYPPEWLPDQETNSCMSCDTLFTLIKRRHHCRSCGKIFCGDCCRQKAKLLYLDNKEARVCSGCFSLIDSTLPDPGQRSLLERNEAIPSPSTSLANSQPHSKQSSSKVQGVLKLSNQTRFNDNECNISAPPEQQCNKQVVFSDGIRPGTDLSESSPYPLPSSSSPGSSTSASSFSLLSRQNKVVDGQTYTKKTKSKIQDIVKNITVCDELGYLPPIVIDKDSPIFNNEGSESTSSQANLTKDQSKSSDLRKSLQVSMESRSCPLNSVINFEDISGLVGIDNTVTFLLLKDFYLGVKIIQRPCTNEDYAKERVVVNEGSTKDHLNTESEAEVKNLTNYWCCVSKGLANFGQNEVLLVIDKDKDDPCIPRDIFKIYLTLHELALRRQTLESLGNLLFQDGLFGYRDTAGLLFVRPLEEHCLGNLVLPSTPFLIAIVLQRWEVPWSKIFPMRLLLRLGHKMNIYPYPLISHRSREPVFYEVGHTIISILGDFRNFRYSITHVDGLRVMLNKTARKVLVQVHESSYQQFNKVLDSSNNEHVLAWSCCPFSGADGHLVSVQNEDGQYETVEFYKKSSRSSTSFEDLDNSETVLGASFIIFSGALKVNQSGPSAKISVVEDGLLIQIQSCTMSALRNSIHYMHHFDIDCENTEDAFNLVEIDWLLDTPNHAKE